MAKDKATKTNMNEGADSVTSTEDINPRTGLVKGGREGTADEAGPAQYGAQTGDLNSQGRESSTNYQTPPGSGETF